MKKRWLALLMAVCLLLGALTGCGDKEASNQTLPESASGELSASLQEDSAAIPEDPQELGKWLWELMEAANEEIYAEDMDMVMAMDVSVDGESTSQNINMRVKKIEDPDGTITSQMDMEVLNSVTKVWYADGVVYLSDPYGDYKAPMEQEDFLKSYDNDSSGDLLELTAEDFETLTGAVTDTGYTITFAGVNLDAWMTFSGLFEDAAAGAGSACKAFDLSGTIELDDAGYLIKETLNLSATFEILGLKLTEEIELKASSNGYNEKVTISVPEDDDAFLELEDITLPSTLSSGYATALSQYALSYQNLVVLSLDDDAFPEEYTQQDDIVYYIGDTGLLSSWVTSYIYNEDEERVVEDLYAGGEGTLTEDGEETVYSYSDEDMLADIMNFITAYSDALLYAGDITTETDGTMMVVTMAVDSEDYAAPILDGYLTSYTELSLYDATDYELTGTMTICFDMTGMMVSQLLEITGEMTFEEEGTIAVSLLDGGDVLAVGDGVLTASNY